MLLRVVHLSPRQVAHARGEAIWAEHLANVASTPSRASSAPAAG
jgi:hypothetical protein